jgi:sec-independent protein translocase protein TatB
MFDLGWSELLVIGIVALIVVGPKDLPIMFRRLGEFTGRARAMAREFSSAMDKAADEAGVKEMRRDLRNLSDPRKMGLDAINKAAEGIDGWDDDLPRGKAAPNSPATTPPVPPAKAQAARSPDTSETAAATPGPAAETASDDRPA